MKFEPSRILRSYRVATVGDLLESLTAISRDPMLCDVLHARIDAEDFVTFRRIDIVQYLRPDGSGVLGFEILEEEEPI